MMKMRKKGISAVVATVLIILITVAAVTIIWSAVIPMIKDNLEAGDDCMKAQSEVSIGTTGYTCLNKSSGQVLVQVSHGPSSFVLEELQVIVHIGGNTYPFLANKTSLPGVNQEKVVRFDNNSIGVSLSSIGSASKVEIAPVLKVGNTKKNCGVSSAVDLGECTV